MRKVVLLAAALVVALGIGASSATSAATETGVTARTVTIGGTFPLTGPASLYATDSGRDEGVLLVHQLAEGAGRQARRLRPADRVQVLRRRLQPRELGAADAEARRGGQGVRPGRPARDGGERVDQAVPQRPQGAADAGLDRRVGVRRREGVPVDRRLAARVRLRVADLRPGDRPQQPEREDRRPLPERRLRQAEILERPQKAGSGPRRRTSSPPSRTR